MRTKQEHILEGGVGKKSCAALPCDTEHRVAINISYSFFFFCCLLSLHVPHSSSLSSSLSLASSLSLHLVTSHCVGVLGCVDCGLSVLVLVLVVVLVGVSALVLMSSVVLCGEHTNLNTHTHTHWSTVSAEVFGVFF